MPDINILHLSITLASGILTGFCVAWIIRKYRERIMTERWHARESVLRQQLQFQEADLAELNHRYASTQTVMEDLRCRINTLSSDNATLKERTLYIPELEEEIKISKVAKDRWIEKNTELEKKISELAMLNAQERKQSEEKIALLNEARDQLKLEFQNLANKIFEDKSQKFAALNKVNIDGVLMPLREQLTDFKKKVEDVYEKEAGGRLSLLNEIGNLKKLNDQISKDAINLTNALKGDSKTQGTWGEIVLERVLEMSGLKKGQEYDIQVSLKSGSGKRYQPDVIIRLPEEKDVVVDSKVSLKAYERYCSADTIEEKDQAFREHIASMRQHIRGLSEKNYEDLEELRSLDFVLMFVPIEAAFLAAVDKDRSLFSEAFEKDIMIVCPSTLLVTLRTIQNIWRYENQNRYAMEIAKRAGNLYDKFVSFVDSLEDVGLQLDKARKTYDTAHRRLISGKGNLINRTQALIDLGVKAKKNLPEKLLALADGDDSEKTKRSPLPKKKMPPKT